ncbi:Arm DNA-binding domain-containing protein [Paraburkholderia youngii]|uniref:Arm DNA-binding domain-containing protein n=1 Tax=Paraburkholderia youngii TaxID=2782701 RepID=UPI003D2295F3
MAKTEQTPLSDVAVRAAVPLEKIRKLYDSLGLLVEIHPSGGKYWRLKYRFAGREKRLALSVFPDVTVRDARKPRDEARQLLAAGIDPGEVRKEERIAQREEEDRREAAMRFMLDSDGHCRSGWGNAA